MHYKVNYSLLCYLFLICFIARFRWVKDGVEFDPSKDPELSVSRDTGTFSLTAKDGPIHQYQGRYNCYASNDLGTAVSNEARIVTESKSFSSLQHYNATHLWLPVWYPDVTTCSEFSVEKIWHAADNSPKSSPLPPVVSYAQNDI